MSVYNIKGSNGEKICKIRAKSPVLAILKFAKNNELAATDIISEKKYAYATVGDLSITAKKQSLPLPLKIIASFAVGILAISIAVAPKDGEHKVGAQTSILARAIAPASSEPRQVSIFKTFSCPNDLILYFSIKNGGNKDYPYDMSASIKTRGASMWDTSSFDFDRNITEKSVENFEKNKIFSILDQKDLNRNLSGYEKKGIWIIEMTDTVESLGGKSGSSGQYFSRDFQCKEIPNNG